MDPAANHAPAELTADTRAALLALPADLLVLPRVDRDTALRLSKHVAASFEQVLGGVATTFAASPAAAIREAAAALMARAEVYQAADALAESPFSEQERSRRVELAKRNRGNDRYLFKWLWALFEDDPELHAELEDIRHGRGKRDDAQDVLREVELFRAHWGQATGRTPVTEQCLADAEQAALEQLKLLEEQSLEHAGSPLDLRRRAYTRWHMAYDLVIRAGRYLAWANPAADKLFPALHQQPAQADRG